MDSSLELRASTKRRAGSFWPLRLPPPQLATACAWVVGLSSWLGSVQEAQAVAIRIDAIEATPDATYEPEDRLGLVTALTTDTSVKRRINIADCKAIKATSAPYVRVTWSWTDKVVTNLTPQYGLKVAPPGKSCDSASMTESSADSGCKVLAQDRDFSNPLTAAGEQFDIDLRTLLGDTDCTVGQELDTKIYFLVSAPAVNGVGGTTVTSANLSIRLDLAGPPAPTIGTVSAGNTNLRVTWSHSDESKVEASRVYWSTDSFESGTLDLAEGASGALTATSYQITGLKNDTKYYVAVAALDDADNVSEGSAVKQATPVLVQDAWEFYRASGGTETGGYAPCSAQRTGSVPTAGLLALVLAGGLFLRRRRLARKTAGTALLAIVAGTAALAPASAEAASPITNSLELRFGQYLPGIDREFEDTNKATPYEDVFGTSGAWDVGLNLDFRTLHGVLGELSFGVGASYWKKEGKALSLSGDKTADKTTLTILPLSLDVAWRFDLLAKRWDIPLIPYVRGGLGYAVWWAENGVGNTASSTKGGKSTEAIGGTGGLHGALGLRLLLDVFEPQAARSFDIEMGVNHSYLFAEYRLWSLNDFGSKTSIDLSDEVLYFGVAFDL
jgi:MYXO-CTERM domain-containing protein